MYINSTITGTMQELLKKHHQQIPIHKPVPPANNPWNRFENTHQQTYPLGDILDEIKKEPRNSFEEYGDAYGTPINSGDYEYDEPAFFFRLVKIWKVFWFTFKKWITNNKKITTSFKKNTF